MERQEYTNRLVQVIEEVHQVQGMVADLHNRSVQLLRQCTSSLAELIWNLPDRRVADRRGKVIPEPIKVNQGSVSNCTCCKCNHNGNPVVRNGKDGEGVAPVENPDENGSELSAKAVDVEETGGQSSDLVKKPKSHDGFTSTLPGTEKGVQDHSHEYMRGSSTEFADSSRHSDDHILEPATDKLDSTNNSSGTQHTSTPEPVKPGKPVQEDTDGSLSKKSQIHEETDTSISRPETKNKTASQVDSKDVTTEQPLQTTVDCSDLTPKEKQVFSYLFTVRNWRSVLQVSNDTGIPKGSVYIYCAALHRKGLLEKRSLDKEVNQYRAQLSTYPNRSSLNPGVCINCKEQSNWRSVYNYCSSCELKLSEKRKHNIAMQVGL